MHSIPRARKRQPTLPSSMAAFIIMILGLFAAPIVEAKAVFAHFMVGNVPTWNVDDWSADIGLAQDAHIDAFALNIATGDSNMDQQISNAFQAAESANFQLFFSFDYAGGVEPWPMDSVIGYLQQYSSSSSYFQYNGKPFASTFEGPANADDWSNIKSQTGCFFMPDWSSLGAMKALEPGTADGLFSWAAWPWGNQDMNTYVDASYLHYLDGMPYMMGVSPWFYTNLPGYNKNWLWKGDRLWFDRWQEVIWLQPDLVEIITWNDYGESHYIGPIHDEEFDLFTVGEAPFNYAVNMPHDGWRLFLPFLIDTYKNGIATIDQELLTSWYRLMPVAACDANGTTGNTASQYQIEFEPQDTMDDSVFFSALLASPADVSVTIGGAAQSTSWSFTPSGGVGVYFGSVPFNGASGEVIVTVSRGGNTVTQMSGASIGGCVEGGFANFNAWVGSAAGDTVLVNPPLNRSEQHCIQGWGTGNFGGLCSFACQYDYCPYTACMCTELGPQPTLPNATNNPGYSANGDANYAGLCSFDCNYGYCPSSACSSTQQPAYTPTVSPFSPLACTAGQGSGNLAGLCSYACNYGFCPINACTCTGEDALILNPNPLNTTGRGVAAAGLDPLVYGPMCEYTCSYNYCPAGACAWEASDGEGGYYPTGTGTGAYPTKDCVFVPPTPNPSPTLTPQSTCIDLENQQHVDGVCIPQPDYYSAVGSANDLQNWATVFNNTQGSPQNFAAGYADPWGVAFTFADNCGDMESSCSPLNAGDMNNQTRPGCATAYLNLLSMQILYLLLDNMWLAAQNVQIFWNSNQDNYNYLINTGVTNDTDSKFLDYLITGIVGAASFGVSFLSGEFPITAAGATAIIGLVGGEVSIALDSDGTSQQQLDDIALEGYASTYLESIKSAYQNASIGLSTIGVTPSGYTYNDLFGNGQFVNPYYLPVNGTGQLRQLTNSFNTSFSIAVTNAAWHIQRTFVMSYPMTEAQFANTTVPAGNNDFRLKAYYQGRGYYLQSIQPSTDKPQIPITQNPPGWGSLQGAFGFMPSDIITTSAASFNTWGYPGPSTNDYIQSIIQQDLGIVPNADILGVFNLAQCMLNSSSVRTPTLTDFVNNLNAPSYSSSGFHGETGYGDSSYCACIGLYDNFGNVFEDFIDLSPFNPDFYCENFQKSQPGHGN